MDTTAAPQTPTVTFEWHPGAPDPTRYRRLLDILFAPDTPTIDSDGLHTEAA